MKTFLLLFALFVAACSPAPTPAAPVDPQTAKIAKIEEMFADLERRCAETGPDVTGTTRRWTAGDSEALESFRIYGTRMSSRSAPEADRAAWKKWWTDREKAGRFVPKSWDNFPTFWANYQTWRQR